ncbi:DUF6263 family protein [uncultured Corynebacterium sp.]|uniref:DUF6263 family protein n=1 Tax=uncultured Corynebacterium sp. TaxID=159447 RepID=UPI0025D3976A|nr:DUF6263 family protein [uncultured Corynebacterium sp.]
MGISSKSALAVCSAIGLAFTAVACSDSEQQQAKPADVAVPGVKVELVSRGASPQEPIAWFSQEGSQEVTFHATQGFAQHTVGASGDAKRKDDATTSTTGASETAKEDEQPDVAELDYDEVTMNLPLSAEVTTDGKERQTNVTVGEPTGTNDERNQDIATAKGFKMTTEQEVDGRATSRNYTAPDEASATARASVESALNQMNDYPLIFPTEPVGVGAKWTVSNRVDGDISMTQKVTYSLLEREGQTVSLKVEVSRRPAVATLAQTDLKVLDVKTESSGQIALDLNKVLPTRGHINVETKVTYGQKNSPIRVVQTTTSKSKWSPEAN